MGGRKINPTMLAAIHLYILQSHIIFAQLATHPQRMAGCWGVKEEEEGNSTAINDMMTSIQSMFGWTLQTSHHFDLCTKESLNPANF
jgi:hypothetical protein